MINIKEINQKALQITKEYFYIDDLSPVTEDELIKTDYYRSCCFEMAVDEFKDGLMKACPKWIIKALKWCNDRLM